MNVVSAFRRTQSLSSLQADQSLAFVVELEVPVQIVPPGVGCLVDAELDRHPDRRR